MPVRLLFVEKDVTTSDLLVPDLEKKGYRVFLARTRRHAMRRCRSVGPDILVVDVASFGTAGHDLLEALRLRVGSLPYILLLEEGHGMAGDQAQAFMTAPFTSRKLLYRLRKVAEALPSRALCA